MSEINKNNCLDYITNYSSEIICVTDNDGGNSTFNFKGLSVKDTAKILKKYKKTTVKNEGFEIYGGYGDDEIYGTEADDKLYGDNTEDDMDNKGGEDIIYGYGGDDYIYAGKGDDTVNGGKGFNVIKYIEGDGKDTIEYGAGTDVLYFSKLKAEDFGIENVSGSLHLKIDEENGILLKDFYNKKMKYYVLDDNVHLPVINKYTELKKYLSALGTIQSGSGKNETIKGSKCGDILYGGARADKIYGYEGNDRIDGGAGNDRIYSGSGDDIINGGAGNDIYYSGAGTNKYELSGNFGQDVLYSNKLSSDRIETEEGNWVYKRSGNDVRMEESHEELPEYIYLKGEYYSTKNPGGKGVIKLKTENIYINGTDIYIICDENFYYDQDGVMHFISNEDKEKIEAAEQVCFGDIYITAGKKLSASSDGNTAIGETKKNSITIKNYLNGSGDYDIILTDGTKLYEHLQFEYGNKESKKGQTLRGYKGKAYNDLIEETYNSGRGNDRIYGGAGINNYVFEGETGNDTIYLSGEENNIILGGGIEAGLYSRSGNDIILTLQNENEGETITGKITLKDYLKGKRGDKVVTINGESNWDEELTFVYDKSKSKSGQTLRGYTGSDTFNIKEEFIGSTKGDKIYTGGGDDIIFAGKGNDVINITGGGKKVININNEDGNDTITGTDKSTITEINILDEAGEYNEEISYTKSKDGKDLVITRGYTDGKGKERRAKTVIKGYFKEFGENKVRINGRDLGEELRNTENTCYGDSEKTGKQNLKGTYLSEEFQGGKGDDVINTGDGDDTVYTGRGNNTVITGNGNDKIELGSGNNTIKVTGTGLKTIEIKEETGYTTVTGLDKGAEINIVYDEETNGDKISYKKAGKNLVLKAGRSVTVLSGYYGEGNNTKVYIDGLGTDKEMTEGNEGEIGIDREGGIIEVTNTKGKSLYGGSGDTSYAIDASFDFSKDEIIISDAGGTGDELSIMQGYGGLGIYFDVDKEGSTGDEIWIGKMGEGGEISGIKIDNWFGEGKIEEIKTQDGYSADWTGLEAIRQTVAEFLSDNGYAGTQAVLESGNSDTITALMNLYSANNTAGTSALWTPQS